MTIYACNDNAHPPSASRNKRRGFTLTEVAIVLGIIGLILGAIWVAAAAVYSNLRVSKATTEILQTAQAIRALYGTSPTTGETAAGDLTLKWAQAGVFPSDLVVQAAGAAPTSVSDPWSGGGTTAGTDTINTLGDAFYIQMSAVPQSACISLLTSMTGPGRDSGLWTAKASTATATTINTATQTTMPISATTAVASCAVGNSNVVAFGFKLKG